MSKKPQRRTWAYNYILSFFKARYEESLTFQYRRDNLNDRKFPNRESIIRFVYEQNPTLVDTNETDKLKPGQVFISRNTIRNAINLLIEDKKIALVNKSFEFVPRIDNSIERHPVLEIADKINITIGVPNDMIVLSVAPEHSQSIANYLSAFFYKGDILFLPIASQILCISVLPARSLNKQTKKSTPISLRDRLEMALHKFHCDYPDFEYNRQYEMGYHMFYNSETSQQLRNAVKEPEKIDPTYCEKHMFSTVQTFILEGAKYDEDLQTKVPVNKISELDTDDDDYDDQQITEPTEADLELMEDPFLASIVDEDLENDELLHKPFYPDSQDEDPSQSNPSN